MLNYLLFLSMVHEYAYFLWIYLETGLLSFSLSATCPFTITVAAARVHGYLSASTILDRMKTYQLLRSWFQDSRYGLSPYKPNSILFSFLLVLPKNDTHQVTKMCWSKEIPLSLLKGTRLRTITMLWICIQAYLLSLDPRGQGHSKGPRKAAVPVIAYRPFI